MISNMAFQVPRVRDFLAEHGHVVTVRGYDYRSKTATVGNLDNIRVTRRNLGEVHTIEDIKEYVPLSGFKTAREWWKQIKVFCGDRMFLYLVKIDDAHISQRERSYEEKEQQRARQDVLNLVEHPTDAQKHPSMRDPALVDLSSYREAAQQKRDDDERRRRREKQERMREQYSEQMRSIVAPIQRQTPWEIMQVSDAENLLSEIAEGIL